MKYKLVTNKTRIPGIYEGICESLDTDRISHPSNPEVLHKLNTYENPTKQYRPFSDSIHVPPIENPIILNPYYNDVLSAQYTTDRFESDNDSEFKKREKELAVKIIVEKLKNVQSRRQGENIAYSKASQSDNYVQTDVSKNIKNEKIEKNQVQFEKEIRLNMTKKDTNLDLQCIKMTAFNIIDENIKKAVSVAEEIKKEMDIELSEKKQYLYNKESINTEKNNLFSESDQKTDCFKTLGEQHAYSLGLQTIPYMKTYMQSNSFKSIVIKQIFLQLTMFMVSLSRHLDLTSTDIFIKRARNSENADTRENVFIDEQELNEEKILSGSEMARKFGKTPLEFTKRMDTVITEFEARTGIEQSSRIQRRSRSRSRSTLNGNFNNHVTSETDGKNIYRAFVTEEWSEYYDLGSEKSKTIKTEKHFESKTMKKETIEKLINEKTIENEMPLTYIAIVQAHVFTNQDAIIQDTLHISEHVENKVTTTENSENKEESLIINTKERIASCTDLEHQLIVVNKDKPFEKVVVVESIEDITPIEEYKLFADIEKVVTGIAVQKTTEVLEPITDISERPLKLVQAKSSTETSNITIASNEAVVIQEETDNSFVLPEVKPRKSITSFEPTLKVVAAKSEIDTIEPRVEILEITDEPSAKSTTVFEKLAKPIAQISEVQISEAQSQPLQIQTLEEHKLKENVETPVQPVAEKSEIYVNDSLQEFEKNIIQSIIPEVATQSSVTAIAETKETFINESFGIVDKMECDQKILQPNVEQVSQIVAETNIPLMDEYSGIFKKGKFDLRRPHILIETPIKAVAEISAPLLNESSADFVEKLTQKGEFNTSIEGAFKTVANKIDICIDELNLDELEKLEMKGETTASSVESTFKSVPETSEVTLNEITEIIETPKYNEDISKILIEMPFSTVAEKTELFVDKVEMENLNSDKILSEKSNIIIETPIKVVAEQSMIITDAPKPDVLEIAELKRETLKTLLDTESSLRFLSKSVIPAIEEPRLESLKVLKEHDEQAKVVINKIDPIATTEVFLSEPNQISFEVPEVITKMPRPLMEDARLTVPETLTTSIQGPKDDILLVDKVAEEYAKVNFRSSEATGVSEIPIFEPQCDSLEVPLIKQQQYQTSLENINMVVPNTELNLTLGPKDDILTIPNTVINNANLKINELKALHTYEVTSVEAIQKASEPFQIEFKQPKVFFEDYSKTVPASTLVRPAESEKIFSILSESIGLANPAVQPLTALAQSAVISIEEVIVGAHCLETSSNKAKISLQGFSATNIAQVNALSSVKLENFQVSQNLKKADVKIIASETAQAAVNKVNVKESQLEITEIIDGEDTCEDVSVDYSIELVKDEIQAKQSNDEYVKLKTVKKQTVEAQELYDEALKSKKQVTKNKKELMTSAARDSEIKYVTNDINNLEKQMTSTVKSVETDFQSKAVDKKLFIEAVSESKLIESDSSKSPSPTSPINDVYLFSVATPYTNHETEIPCVELDYRPDVRKQQYTQAEISVAESIAIELQASDSEEEKQLIEKEYEYQKHQFESISEMSGIVSSHQKDQSLEFNKSVSKQESKSSHAYESQSKSTRESLQQDLQLESKEINQNKKTKVKKSTAARAHRSDAIQALEINRQSLQKDIKVIESDIETSHALLLTVDTSISNIAASVNKDITSELKQMNQEVKSPSPPIQPPTPLTDEYMFRLTAPLPSREGTPVPRDCTSSSESEEDIVKQKLIPHIELTIEQRIFDPPLPTPPTSPPVASPSSTQKRRPFYSKPGLRGGGDRLEITEEEDLEIRRKSTLLASAIDKTIKSIEEYKSEVGMESVNVDYQSSSEIITSSSTESKAVKEIKTLNDDNKVEVLIDKIVETSKRFSGEGSERDDIKFEANDDTPLNSNEKEYIVPTHQEYTESTRPDTQSERVTEDIETIHRMDTNKLSEQLLQSVQSMVDPSASIEERLSQMQAQIAELSRLPELIHRTLDAVKIQFEELNYEMQQKAIDIQMSQNVKKESIEETQVSDQILESLPTEQPIIEVTESVEVGKETEESLPVELQHMEQPDEEIQRIIEKRRLEAENKEREEIMKERLSQELRIAAERLSPRLGFEQPELGVPQKLSPNIAGPVADGKPNAGKIWKKLDNYDDNNLEQILSETLGAQAEVIKGNAIGVNFMKYEKPPPALDHLQNSEVYKAIHDVDQKPLKKVELLRPAIAASDYVQRLRSVSPSPAKTLIEDCEV